MVRRADNRGNHTNQSVAHENHHKHKTIAVLMAVFLVVIIIAGIYILNEEGKIDIPFFNRTASSNDGLSVSNTPQPEENIEDVTLEPEVTPDSTPEPTAKVYIPDIGELQALPDPSTIALTENKLHVEITAEVSVVKWDEYSGASYYVLAVYNSRNDEIQKDILWANITEWQIPNFTSGKIILYVYKDNGESAAEDDVVIDIYAHEVLPVTGEVISFAPGREKYYILVDKSSFAMSVFTYDENGQYTVLLHTFPCAIGQTDRMTPPGVWEISSKGPWKLWTTGWYSPYYSKFVSGSAELYIHGAVYAKADFSTLSPTSYEKIGTKATSGCLRTTVEGAEWIYYNCPAGTIIEIVESSDLVVYPGKPAVDPDYPNWDPTDPNKPGN